jgi:hypothetical protein
LPGGPVSVVRLGTASSRDRHTHHTSRRSESGFHNAARLGKTSNSLNRGSPDSVVE